MTSQAAPRQRRALEAAISIARAFGLPCHQAYVLKDSNNTVVHLAPSAVVAKVGTTTIRAEPNELLGREVAIGLHLARRRAPIAPPASEIPPGPYRHDAFTVTFWSFRPHEPDRRADHRALAAALRRLHDAFQGYAGRLPSFVEVVGRAGSVVADSSVTPRLGRGDRAFLIAAHERISRRSRGLQLGRVTPLHGDPHLDGNVLLTPDGPVFVDFEGACTGPPEWDLTALPSEVARNYVGADVGLVDQLRDARSLCVAAWCWMQPERAPEVDEAARFHLNVLRHRGVA